ncbi:unnamed protein product [Cuscuta campestris]|uniref:F-box domain-containing protein n=2 Tax=Cuscuta sect. Cleistogrammica TaxID=1824901 RepID=A0A484MP54_9ASTE|nr:hypothetical protein DM860_013609 [Cuscuta australis]VFQ90635.1 unnamed protein product [Cuscuta campestris]
MAMAEEVEEKENAFSELSDDIVLNIFHKLDGDPRNWARLSCVSTKFSSLIRNLCCESKCSQTIPSVVADLVSDASAADPPCGWPSLYKLVFCCPGLLHSGVLLESSDFGLERELGPDEDFRAVASVSEEDPPPHPPLVKSAVDGGSQQPDCGWSLFDDLMFDTLCDASESSRAGEDPPSEAAAGDSAGILRSKRRRTVRSGCSHMASGAWNLSREQGIKLLASRFREDRLYISEWPGCLHVEEKRNYMLFRGIFKNFKQSRVWRTINDGNRKQTDLNCAFCNAKHTWDLYSAFCLRRYFGFHEDGEQVVRAYVCENGHVSGAWTDWSLYT